MIFGPPPFWKPYRDPTIYDAITATVFDSNSPGWAGFTMRTVCPASEINASALGKLYARVRFRAATNGSFDIVNAYIGHRAASGDTWDFETTPVQLLFSGAVGTVVPAGGTVMSDWAAFSIGSGKGLIVSNYSSAASSARRRDAGSTRGSYYKSANEAATVDATGYDFSNNTYLIDIIQASDVPS